LKDEKGSIFFQLYWQGKKNVGVAPTPPPGEMAIPFLPVSETEFAGYRIDTAVHTKLGFKMDDKGSIVGMVVPGKESFFALREK
jgi:hypothetical protein